MTRAKAIWSSVLAVLVLGLCIFGGLVYAGYSEGNKHINQLNKQYEVNQEVLTRCLYNKDQAVQVALMQDKSVREAAEAITTGRYKAMQGASNDALMKVVVENYPDTKAFNVPWDRVAITALGCQNEYGFEQRKLLEMIEKFENWRTATLNSKFAIGVDIDRLQAVIDEKHQWYGEDALARMREVTMYAKATDALIKGELPEPNLFPSPSTK